MITRNANVDSLDPKTGFDQVGYAASLGMLDAASSGQKTESDPAAPVSGDGSVMPAARDPAALDPVVPVAGDGSVMPALPAVQMPASGDPVTAPRVLEATDSGDAGAADPVAGSLELRGVPIPPDDDGAFKAPGGDDADQGGFHPIPDIKFFDPTGVFPIYGTDGIEDIDGTESDDIIYALGGSDGAYGHGGNDIIDGGDGHDLLTGDAGNDYLIGGDGDDLLSGDGITGKSAMDGDDHLEGGNGHDILYGRGGDDWLFAGAGLDAVYGGTGDDTLIASAGRDDLYGGFGADAFLSLDDITQHDIWDYSAAEGDTVEGVSWEYDAGTNTTAVYSELGSPVFLIHNYNAGVSGINLVDYAPEPAA